MATTPLDVAKEATAQVRALRANEADEAPLAERLVNAASWANPSFCIDILSEMADFDSLPESNEEASDFYFTESVSCWCDEHDCICDDVGRDLARECLAVAAERNAAE